MAMPSKTLVCCRSIAEIVGSNPDEGMSVLVLCLLCVVLAVVFGAS